MGEPPVLTDEQIADVVEKFKTYGQQSAATEKSLKAAE
jgi:L-fuculose-phosphate aldolase